MNKRKDELRETKHFKRIAESEKFIKIPSDWAVRFELSPPELLIYSTIAHATKYYEHGAFIGSVTSLCAMWNISASTANRALEKLDRRGMIVKEHVIINGKGVIAYRQLKVVQLKIDDL